DYYCDSWDSRDTHIF
nr:immunoglobulin light chain junction region [Macaca mulatta]MOW67453.1 immunoglobulin light chain junction region [Macaca mulatta]MOW70800.1 immunoglobulin light chain junction region [Macaca mulatta]